MMGVSSEMLLSKMKTARSTSVIIININNLAQHCLEKTCHDDSKNITKYNVDMNMHIIQSF